MAAPIYKGGAPFQNVYRRFKNSVVGPIVGTGAPTDGIAGTGVGVAGPGSWYVNYANGTWYYNSNTKASPTWIAFGSTAGAATPTSVVSTGAITSSSPAAGIGYSAGAGGAVAQITSKATGVVLDKITGAITMHNAALNDGVSVSFTVTNAEVAATDAVIVNHASAGTAGAYSVQANAIGAGSFKITVRNESGGNLGEAIVLRFAIIKAVSA